ncbi:flavin-containing monooxygenase [Ornithinicoccus halotolerans]|uniref:flavin-containing monooxygenase n=1 Tax=Ornithinicoccus halotolerans TaxID=1748220 RepID=UPI001885DAB6|nr:NAD(P)/FAD-dependent oxidoreductase [Ornithinicoccus halotolerans]
MTTRRPSPTPPAKTPQWGDGAGWLPPGTVRAWTRTSGRRRPPPGGDTDADVVVIGSGPAGLASAAELVGRGVRAVVLERGPAVGAAWRSRYDGLRFNTSRRASALPRHSFPRGWGQFPTRDQYVSYLEDYAAGHRIDVRTGVEAVRVEREECGWLVRTVTGQVVNAAHVVVATGICQQPSFPDWARGHHFAGPVLHASDYRNAAPFRGHRVVLVGAGSTGMEIAHELARGGAAAVSLSVRTPPNVLLRRVGGLPGDWPVPLLLRLRTGVVDPMLAALQRVVIGDLRRYGLPRPTQGCIAGLRARGAGTAVVDREVVEGIRAGLVRVVPAVVGLTRSGVCSSP